MSDEYISARCRTPRDSPRDSQPGRLKDPYTPNNPIQARTQHLRRHGLSVSDDAPDSITIFMDIPNGTHLSPMPPKPINHILNVILWLIEQVEDRLTTKEFCNPLDMPMPTYSRIRITVVTDKGTPFGVYMAVYEALVSLLESLLERDARGEILEINEDWAIVEDCVCVQWDGCEEPLNTYFNSPVVNPRWRDGVRVDLPILGLEEFSKWSIEG